MEDARDKAVKDFLKLQNHTDFHLKIAAYNVLRNRNLRAKYNVLLKRIQKGNLSESKQLKIEHSKWKRAIEKAESEGKKLAEELMVLSKHELESYFKPKQKSFLRKSSENFLGSLIEGIFEFIGSLLFSG